MTTRSLIVLSTPLRRGAQYPVTCAFPVPIGLHNPEVYATRYLGRELRMQGEIRANSEVQTNPCVL